MHRLTIAQSAIALSVLALLGPSAFSTPAQAASANIPQPALDELKHLPVAPLDRRVDMKMPTFSNPTNITHPLFPVNAVSQTILLGHEDGTPLQVIYTLLPESHNRTIVWNGKKIETRTVQYVAHLDRRITEYALDWYAQSDDGSVWYFGEDVFNFQDGVVTDTEGTWLAGKDGPAAMIMPAKPVVGNVYRVENLPGKAFEEIRVKAAGAIVDGPLGPVKGCMIGEQLHMDATYSDKTFCPGYGEFFTAKDLELEAMAIAAPTDVVTAPQPAQLDAIGQNALRLYGAAEKGGWNAADGAANAIRKSWTDYRGRIVVSKPAAAQMERALLGLSGDAIEPGLAARHKIGAQIGAIEVALSNLDLKLRHSAPIDVDRERFHIWTQKTSIDVRAQNQVPVLSDIRTLELIRDRIAHTIEPVAAKRLNALLKKLRASVEAENFNTAAATVQQLLNTPALEK